MKLTSEPPREPVNSSAEKPAKQDTKAAPESAAASNPNPPGKSGSQLADAEPVANTRERALRAWETRRRNLQLKPIIHAISIRQPYAEIILCGKKREEYRSRPTLVKGRVYLYAALRAGDTSDWQKLGKRPGELPTGKVVGSVEITGCHWNPSLERYAYVLRGPIRLRRPLIPKNQPLPCFWKPQF